jgi:FMN-dependent NADH-azoreductase
MESKMKSSDTFLIVSPMLSFNLNSKFFKILFDISKSQKSYYRVSVKYPESHTSHE